MVKINRLRRTTKHSENHRGDRGLDFLFDEHIAKEFVDRNVDATTATMAPDPYVYNVPAWWAVWAVREFVVFTASTS